MQNEKLQKEQLEQLKSSLVMFRSITIFFLLVVALGTLIFHIIEKWSWLDSIYFVVVTVATVGYGNLVPTSDIGKIANIILIIVGIGIFGVFVNQFVKYQGLKRIERHQHRKDKKSKN